MLFNELQFKSLDECESEVAYAFDPNFWEAEAGGFLSTSTAWVIEWVSGQQELYRATLSQIFQKKSLDGLKD